MDPTPSSTPSTEMMIHGEKLGHSKSATDYVLHGALGAMQAPSSTTADALAAAAAVFAGVIPPRVYRCMFCTNTFMSAQALGGHQNAHKRERAKIFHPSGQWPAPNCLAYNDRGGPYYRAPINGAAQYWRGRHSVPSYARQAGTSLGAAQGSSGANVPAPVGYRWTGVDGGHLGRQSSMRELNQEETPDGIDLTLKL